MSKYSAYTLIEILIVVSIIGLVLSFGLIEYRAYSRHQALILATRNLVTNLKLTQEYVLVGRKPSSSCTILDGYKFKIVSATQVTIHPVCDNTSEEAAIKTVNFPTDISISPILTSVVFRVLGRGTDLIDNLPITLTQISTGATQTVTVDISGKISW